MVGALAIDIVAYTYDNLDRIKTMRYNDVGVLVTYTYDYMGNVAVAKVTNTAKTVEYATYLYEYDSLGRLIRYFETLEDEIVQQVETSYDSKNRTASYAYFDGAQMHSVEYTYDTDKSGVLKRYDYGADGALGYDYDALNRVTKKYIRHDAEDGADWTVAYNYKAGSATNQTTSLISQMQYTIGSENYTFNYTYDNLGNITEVTDAGGNTVAKYMYDELNQLQLEEVYNGSEAYTMLYDYDTFGNLLSAKKYSGTGFSYPSQTSYGTLISTETYGYTDASWKDLLTSYNGTSITYDTIGNPLSYNNGQSYTFTWERGKQLASAVTGGKTIDFEYNANGIRTEKHVSGTANYYYRLDGNQVVEMVKESELGTQRYVFLYDDQGNPHALYYYSAGSTTPTKYYYVLNLQGDVVQLRNSSYAVVANYTYDAWGKLLSVTNASGTAITSSTHIANVNPIRYRGYFYDTETKLYYCNSRYYDPQVRRFINAEPNLFDGDFDANSGLIGYNAFTYCANNPINNKDVTGQFLCTLIGGAIGGICGGAFALMEGKSWKEVKASAVNGAIAGATSGLAADFIIATGGSAGVVIGAYAAAGALGSVAGNVAENLILDNYANKTTGHIIKEIFYEAAWGGAFGAVFGAIEGPVKSMKEVVLSKAGKKALKAGIGWGTIITKTIAEEARKFISSVAKETTSNFTSWYAKYVMEESLK